MNNKIKKEDFDKIEKLVKIIIDAYSQTKVNKEITELEYMGRKISDNNALNIFSNLVNCSKEASKKITTNFPLSEKNKWKMAALQELSKLKTYVSEE